jgi:hypothetical protein
MYYLFLKVTIEKSEKTPEKDKLKLNVVVKIEFLFKT